MSNPLAGSPESTTGKRVSTIAGMTFHWPWALSGLVVVAGVAIWSLFRPGRQLVVVASLSLWQKAVDALDRSAKRRSRLVTASWVLLLAGAVAAVVAAAGPAVRTARPIRRIAVEVFPSAEIASKKAMGELRGAATALLDRLNEHDRVRLAVAGRPAQWMSSTEARRQISDILPLAATVHAMDAAPIASGVQHTIRFAPAGVRDAGGPNVSIVAISHDLPPVTLDAIGAAALPDGRMQLYVALRNQTDRPVEADMTCRGVDAAQPPVFSLHVTLTPGERKDIVRTIPAVTAVVVDVTAGGDAWSVSAAFLARRPASTRTVALLGPDEPLLRRFVSAAAGLELVASAADADVVIANRVAPPANRAALVIDPPTPPPGWRRGKLREAVVLDSVDVAADDPVMRHVEPAGIAVRRVTPWVPAQTAGQKRLVTLDGEGLILRNEPVESPDRQPPPRRVYVAFAIDSDNTNLSMTEAFVIFLANAVDWLAPGKAEQTYTSETPLQTGPQPGWKRLAGREDFGQGDLPGPGLYQDRDGRLHAVSLTGLRAAQASMPPLEAVAALSLPDPVSSRQDVDLWPALAVAAMGLWLTGWAMRVK